MSSSVTTDEARSATKGPPSWRDRAKAWLASRQSTKWIVALGALLVASSLTGPLVANDFFHAIVLRHISFPQPQSGPFNLFRFANGNASTAKAMMNIGQFPWPADPTCRFAFFRPLAAATHVLDYALFPSSPLLMHAENVAWSALATIAIAAVYRRFLGATWVAGLALLFYALDDTHGQAVGWIANRNARHGAGRVGADSGAPRLAGGRR